MTDSSTAVQAASDAIDEGDYKRATEVLDDIDEAQLTDADRSRLKELRALTGRDPAAVGVTITLAILLVVIIAFLYL